MSYNDTCDDIKGKIYVITYIVGLNIKNVGGNLLCYVSRFL